MPLAILLGAVEHAWVIARPSGVRLAFFLAVGPFCLVALGWTADIGAPPVGTPGAPKAGVRTWSSGLFIDPASREASRVLFRSVYASSVGVASGFTGDVETGVAGDTTAAFKDATIKRINYYRAMAGVPADIEHEAKYAALAQKAALIMAANQQLSHAPPKEWKHWSEDGAQGAGKSNLGLGDVGPYAIDSYLLDPGNNNTRVGHRKWVLSPGTRNMGSGDVEAHAGKSPANALYVIDSSPGAFTTRDPWIAWPPRGYVPYQTVFPRWSFAVDGADFSAATVTLTRDGAPLAVTVQSRNEGPGFPAIVFVPSGFSTEGWGAMPRPTKDVRFDVRIDGVLVSGKARSYSYTTIAFEPAVTGTDTVQPTISGPEKAGVGTNAGYSFTAVPRADDYHWQRARLGGAFQDGAEAGPTAWTKDLGAYEPTVSPGAQGAKAFRLAHATCRTESLLVDRTFYVEGGSRLRFKSRRTWASSAQASRVDVKVDGSGAWQTVWSDATAANGAGAWRDVDVSLASFAGYGVRVRFAYDCGGTFYPANTGGGWAFDDVNVDAAQILETKEFEVQAGATSFWYAVESGKTLLRVRPRFLGRYWLDWGPGKLVEGSGVATAPIPPPAVASPPPPTQPPTASPSATPGTTPTAPWTWTVPTVWPAPTAAPSWPAPSAWPAWPGGFAWPVPVTPNADASSKPPSKPPPKPQQPTPATPDLPFPLPFPIPSALPLPLPKG